MDYVQGGIRLYAIDGEPSIPQRSHKVKFAFSLRRFVCPGWANPALKILQQLGLEHEKAYVDNSAGAAWSRKGDLLESYARCIYCSSWTIQ